MKIGVTGANGFIGKALVKAGAIPLLCDVTKPEELESEIDHEKLDVILHLAGKSSPDWCEQKENEPTLTKVSVRGTHNVFHQATMRGIPCVLMSTGQIWRGGFWEYRPHREDEKLTPPVNQYGKSKLAAESIVRNIFFGSGGKIIRSSYVFDSERVAPKLDKLRKGEVLCEPVFIRRSFIYLPDFVELLLEYCGRINEMPDILHLAGSETVSYYDFTWELARYFALDKKLVQPRKNEEEGHAPRPHNAGLDTTLARRLGFKIPDYIDGIKRMRNE